MRIATQGSRPASRGRKAIQVRADILDSSEALAPFLARLGVAAMPDDPTTEDEAGREAGWLEADLKRAIAAAEEAGLKSYRVEIKPDGTISIIVGD